MGGLLQYGQPGTPYTSVPTEVPTASTMPQATAPPSIAQGYAPLTNAFIEAWRTAALPQIQQQYQLQGLGQSPAVGLAAGESLAQTLPGFITQGEQLTQSAAGLAADIANQEQMRQLQALQTGGQLYLGLTDPFSQAAQLQQEQQRLGLQATAAGGELERGIAQEYLDAQQAERLRLQGLGEQFSTGLFGSSVLPPVAQQVTKSSTSSSK